MYTYLALGDSYTIGEAVAQEESFPFQLKNLLDAKGLTMANPVVVAKTGWTTDELLAAVTAAEIKDNFDMVTLLIGVNNQYRNYPVERYKLEFERLLKIAIDFSYGNANKVLVISIPDWGVTPFGTESGRDVKQIATEIDIFNAAKREVCIALGVEYTDITAASRQAATNAALTAGDGLHPSKLMYNGWAVALADKVVQRLK